GVADVPDTLGVGLRKPTDDLAEVRLVGAAPAVLPVAAEAEAPRLQAAQRFLQGLLEGPADGHRLADRLHLRRQGRLDVGELLEGRAWHLGDDIVDGRLEAGRRLAGNVVAQLVEAVADGQLGGDLGDGEAGRLGGQGRAARHARVHLDGHHVAVGRVD